MIFRGPSNPNHSRMSPGDIPLVQSSAGLFTAHSFSERSRERSLCVNVYKLLFHRISQAPSSILEHFFLPELAYMERWGTWQRVVGWQQSQKCSKTALVGEEVFVRHWRRMISWWHWIPFLAPCRAHGVTWGKSFCENYGSITLPCSCCWCTVLQGAQGPCPAGGGTSTLSWPGELWWHWLGRSRGYKCVVVQFLTDVPILTFIKKLQI